MRSSITPWRASYGVPFVNILGENWPRYNDTVLYNQWRHLTTLTIVRKYKVQFYKIKNDECVPLCLKAKSNQLYEFDWNPQHNAAGECYETLDKT